MRVPFNGWMPDKPDYENPGEIDASGVMPDEAGYRPVGSFSSVVTGLDARAMGAAAVTDKDGNALIVAGSATKLYRNSAGTFSDVSKSGGYNTGADGRWEFNLHHGTLLATNYDDAVQAMSLTAGAIMADAIDGTYKPKARTICGVGDFTLLGNTNDTTDGQKPSRVWWSGFNDYTDFDPAASTQCDFQDIPVGGWVQRLIGGEYALVFMETQIIRAPYVGPPLVFDFSAVIDKQRGTDIPGSVAALGRLVFFHSPDGFFAQDGTQSTPIGDGKVDREFRNAVSSANFSRVSAAIDPTNKLYVVSYPGPNSSAGSPDTVLFYHWPTGKWAYAMIDNEIVFNSLTLGLTLDELDTISATLEALPYTLDSRAWTGGRSQLGIFNTSHAAGTLSGSNLAASVTVGERQIYPGRIARVRRVKPLVDVSSATIAIRERRRLADSVTTKTAVAMTTSGRCPVNSKAAIHSATLAIPAAASWTFAQGLEVDAVQAGTR